MTNNTDAARDSPQPVWAEQAAQVRMMAKLITGSLRSVAGSVCIYALG